MLASIVRGFLSSATNRRTDGYGGSLTAPASSSRSSARCAVIGNRLALGVRLCGDELIDGGTTIDDAVRVAELVEATGQVDYINTSIGVATATLFMIEASMHVPPGYALFIERAAQGRRPTRGRCGPLQGPAAGRAGLAEGHCDLVGVVRGQIADADFAAKARAGATEDIRLCLSCNQECVAWDSTGGWAASRTLARAASPRAPAFPGECALRRMCWSSVPGPQGCRRPSPRSERPPRGV